MYLHMKYHLGYIKMGFENKSILIVLIVEKCYVKEPRLNIHFSVNHYLRETLKFVKWKILFFFVTCMK